MGALIPVENTCWYPEDYKQWESFKGFLQNGIKMTAFISFGLSFRLSWKDGGAVLNIRILYSTGAGTRCGSAVN